MIEAKKLQNLSLILFAFAGGLLASNVAAWAQDAVNVTTTEGGTQEVPTLEEQIRTSITSWIGLLVAVFTAIGFIIRTGLFDRWVKRETQEKYFNTAQMNFLALKKVLEDKVLMKYAIESGVSKMSPEEQEKARKVLVNLDDQITATTEQIDFYTKKAAEHVKPGQLSSLSPDLVDELPREDNNIAYDMESIPKVIRPLVPEKKK
jgi:hypothetical protein